MPKKVIAEGKTTNEAIENGLKELKASKDMVDIKVLDGEKRSFYSILAPRVVKVELTLKDELPKKDSVKKNVKEKSEKPIVRERKKVSHTKEELKKVEEILEDFLKQILPPSVRVEIKEEDDAIAIDVFGEDVNHLIGYRGATINALQVILNAVANKNSEEKMTVVVDVEKYKERRVETLKELAEKISNTVIKTGKSVALEPMTAYERKIIHTALQNDNRIKTISKGEEPYRKVVISLNK